MKIMRFIAALMCIAMLSCAFAEAPEEPAMPAEEIMEFVALMFGAAAASGTEAMPTDCADYRARTLPWLMAAFEGEGPVEVPLPTATPEPEIEDETGKGAAYLALMQSMGGETMDECLQITRDTCEMWLMQVDHAMLTEMNPDYRFWLYAPDTQIDYPVVQGADNSAYLHRLFNGEPNAAGTLFIDYRNLPDFRDPNTLVYGHHMRNDSMFGALTDYADQTYFDAHPLMLIITPTEIALLEIFAGYTTDKRDHCYDIAISDDEDMLNFAVEAAEKSDFVSGVEIAPGDRLVTLSTCAYAFENARYILIGRLITLREIPPEDPEAGEDMP